MSQSNPIDFREWMSAVRAFFRPTIDPQAFNASVVSIGDSIFTLGKLRSGHDILCIMPSGEPTNVIISGFHGDEPAGPLAILRWLETRGVPEHSLLIPLINPTGFLLGTHANAGGLNPNRGFTESLTEEGQILVNSAVQILQPAVLTLHEDVDVTGGHYIYESGPAPAANFVRSALSAHFPPATVPEEDVVEGVGPFEFDGSFEHWVWSNGSTAITVETPGKDPLEDRISAQIDAMEAFICGT